MARRLASKVGPFLSQSIVIENRGGAQATISAPMWPQRPSLTAVADGAQPIGGTAEDLDRIMRAERVKWEAVVKTTGMRAQ